MAYKHTRRGFEPHTDRPPPLAIVYSIQIAVYSISIKSLPLDGMSAKDLYANLKKSQEEEDSPSFLRRDRFIEVKCFLGLYKMINW